MGTRFLATKEAPVHDNVKKALVDADGTMGTEQWAEQWGQAKFDA
jgi:NAD(P)H-dependent flavin oxidoreductase YrpB (nitropropane dioxygenase family)